MQRGLKRTVTHQTVQDLWNEYVKLVRIMSDYNDQFLGGGPFGPAICDTPEMRDLRSRLKKQYEVDLHV
jgi:hypothetical protein